MSDKEFFREVHSKVYKTRAWLVDGDHAKTGTADDRLAAHHEYYAQFATDRVKAVVRSQFKIERLKEAFNNGDVHFNECTALKQWDCLSNIMRSEVGSLMTKINYPDKTGVVVWSLSEGVCVAKTAARVMCEELVC